MNGLKTTFDDRSQEISNYTSLTRKMQNIPEEMISSSRKQNFNKELDEIINQFNGILDEIQERTKDLLRSNDQLDLINQNLDLLNSQLTKIETVFESVTKNKLTSENCGEKLKILINLNQVKLERVAKELNIIKLQLAETYDNLDTDKQNRKREMLFEKYTELVAQSSREEKYLEKIVQKIDEIRSNYKHLRVQVDKIKANFAESEIARFLEVPNFDNTSIETIRNLQNISKQLEKLHLSLDMNRQSLQNVIQENHIGCDNLLLIADSIEVEVENICEKVKKIVGRYDTSRKEQIKVNEGIGRLKSSYLKLVDLEAIEKWIKNAKTMGEIEEVNRVVQDEIDKCSVLLKDVKNLKVGVLNLNPDKARQINAFFINEDDFDIDEITLNQIKFLKTVEEHGGKLFELLHIADGKQDEAEYIRKSLAESDQDLFESKAKLKGLLKKGILADEVKRKLSKVSDEIMIHAKVHAKRERRKSVNKELNGMFESVNSVLEEAKFVPNLEVLNILENQHSRLLRVYQEKGDLIEEHKNNSDNKGENDLDIKLASCKEVLLENYQKIGDGLELMNEFEGRLIMFREWQEVYDKLNNNELSAGRLLAEEILFSGNFIENESLEQERCLGKIKELFGGTEEVETLSENWNSQETRAKRGLKELKQYLDILKEFDDLKPITAVNVDSVALSLSDEHLRLPVTPWAATSLLKQRNVLLKVCEEVKIERKRVETEKQEKVNLEQIESESSQKEEFEREKAELAEKQADVERRAEILKENQKIETIEREVLKTKLELDRVNLKFETSTAKLNFDVNSIEEQISQLDSLKQEVINLEIVNQETVDYFEKVKLNGGDLLLHGGNSDCNNNNEYNDEDMCENNIDVNNQDQLYLDYCIVNSRNKHTQKQLDSTRDKLTELLQSVRSVNVSLSGSDIVQAERLLTKLSKNTIIKNSRNGHQTINNLNTLYEKTLSKHLDQDKIETISYLSNLDISLENSPNSSHQDLNNLPSNTKNMPSDSDIVRRHKFMQSLELTENRFLKYPKKDQLWQETSFTTAKSYLSHAKSLLNQHRSELEILKNVNYSENDNVKYQDVQTAFDNHEQAIFDREIFLKKLEVQIKDWNQKLNQCETVDDWNKLQTHSIHGLLSSTTLKNKEYLKLSEINKNVAKQENVKLLEQEYVAKLNISGRDKEFMNKFIDVITDFECRNGVLDISFSKEIENEMESVIDRLDNLDIKTNVKNIRALSGAFKVTTRNDLINRNKKVKTKAEEFRDKIKNIDQIGDGRDLDNLTAHLTEIIQWCQNVSSDIKESKVLDPKHLHKEGVSKGTGLLIIETDIKDRKEQLKTIQLVKS